jgi:acyl-CoA thioesterase
MQPEEIAHACAAKMWERDQAARGLGLRMVAVGAGTATVEMDVQPDMSNGHGTCHGGLVFMLADSALSLASNSQDDVSLAYNCTITFLEPGRIGDVLRATATERRCTGRTALYDVTVTRRDGTAIAEFHGLTRRTGKAILP